ncbi:MerR family transcriptional regulator [bacterium]|nr:MerR family transcriptional regulator [bacterium]
MSGESEGVSGLKGISEVAQETGIPESTLRYYDSEFSDSLDIKRDSANRRMFDEKDIRQILYIRRLVKKDGLSVKQVKDRLAMEKDILSGGKGPDEAAMNLLSERITRIERQQDLLVKAVESILQETRHLRRLLDLNLTRFSMLLGEPKGK